MSPRARIAVLAAVVAIAVVAFLVAKPGGGSKKSKTQATTPSTQTATMPARPQPRAPAIPLIVVRHAKPVGGVKKITVKKGGRVRFKVVSDVADEIHVHGYDFHKDVTAGGSVSFDFPAKIDGVFVVELESRSEQIASLQVNP
jgi:hypothetical protein